MSLVAGQIVAEKYRIIRQIGQGGMGAVFEGENTRIRRRVAIKTLHGQMAGMSDVVARFEREAQAAGRIGSAHIVEVLDMGELPDGSRFMVMEFLQGQTLGERITSKGRIPPRDMAPILDQLLEGLDAAHQAGIIHRDLKPANVFLVPGRDGASDFVKILDFGVSKFSVLGGEEMSMTRTGAVVGTPYYMSPEQAKGSRNIDARADLYSVGVILYEAITGQVPFSADTFNELIFKIALESPPPPEQFVPNLDPGFAQILRRAMLREAGERFQTAGELRTAIASWAAQPAQAPPEAPPVQIGLMRGGTIAMDAAPVGPPPGAPRFDEPAHVPERRGASGTLAFLGMAVAGLTLGVAGFFVYSRSTGEPARSGGDSTTSAPARETKPTRAEPAPTGPKEAETTIPAGTTEALVLAADPMPSSTHAAATTRSSTAAPRSTTAATAPRTGGTASQPARSPATAATPPANPGQGRPIDENL